MGKAGAARKLVAAAAYGGGGLSAGRPLYGLLRAEATLARKTIGQQRGRAAGRDRLVRPRPPRPRLQDRAAR